MENETYENLKMGGYKLNSFQLFDYLKQTVTSSGLMGKKYSTDPDNPYVCTTFVSEALSLLSVSIKKYLPGGQKVTDSINQLDDLTESDGKNPEMGTYLFYFDYEDGTGHTGFVRFDEDGNAEILHNGKSNDGSECVNIRTRDSRDFKTWFTHDDSGKLYYKKFEEEIWTE